MQTFGSGLKQTGIRYLDSLTSVLVFPFVWIAFHLRLNKTLIRRSLSTFLISTGTVLILYVAGSYYSAYRAQRRLMRQWQQQSTSEQAPQEGPALTRISIPKIGLDAVIVEGTNPSSLALGPGHLLATALPGQSGNAVIAGHRDTFFRHLYRLAPGDDIFVRRYGKSFHYVVSGKRVVDADDISVLRSTSRSVLTLITCFPMTYVGPAPQRLIVRARLAPASQPLI